MWAKIIVLKKNRYLRSKISFKTILALKKRNKGKIKSHRYFVVLTIVFRSLFLAEETFILRSTNLSAAGSLWVLQRALMLWSLVTFMYSVCKQSKVFTNPTFYNFTKSFCLQWLNIFLFKKQTKTYILYSGSQKEIPLTCEKPFNKNLQSTISL